MHCYCRVSASARGKSVARESDRYLGGQLSAWTMFVTKLTHRMIHTCKIDSSRSAIFIKLINKYSPLFLTVH